MRVLNDYLCSDCLTATEEFIEPSVKTILCTCGGVKHQVMSCGGNFFKINGVRMDIDTMAWAKKREANAKRKNS